MNFNSNKFEIIRYGLTGKPWSYSVGEREREREGYTVKFTDEGYFLRQEEKQTASVTA